MVQRIGDKKLKLCEDIAGRRYSSGWHRGSWPHGVFRCVHPREGDGPMDADWVNIRTRTVTPSVRNGFSVEP